MVQLVKGVVHIMEFVSVCDTKAKAIRAFNQMRETADQNGYMSEEEIEVEIQAARAER